MERTDGQQVRTQVEQLAVRLVMAEEPADGRAEAGWLEGLRVSIEEVRSQAATLGWQQAAEAARRMYDAARAGVPWEETRTGLERGLAELEAALEWAATHPGGAADPVPAGGAIEPQEEAPAPALPGLGDDVELLGDFVIESRDHLQAIEGAVLALEQEGSGGESIHGIFRAFHSIKGLAGFLELHEIREVAHEVETLLGLAREGKLEITPHAIDVILEAADFLNHWVHGIEDKLAGRAPQLPPGGGALIRKVRTARETPGPETPGPETPASETPASSKPAAGPTVGESPVPQAPDTRPETAPPASETATPDEEDSDEPSSSAEAAGPPVLPAPQPAAAARVEGPAQPPPAEREPAGGAARTSGAAPAAGPASGAASSEYRSVKVHTSKLDYLVDMVGELVIAQSLVRHDPDLALNGKPRLAHNLAQLARITDEVQRTAMSMRMVPIGPLFQKMSRLVRDLARKSGKQAELEVSGEGTELDRTIVEQLADPLMHMVRNSVDHGVEPPEERVAAGKTALARVRLEARHESGHIVVEVSDDGRGLNRDRILAKARKNGLIGPNDSMSDQEAFALIFEPGFSTAEKVTDVSGRGVGMDVVKRNVQKLRGRIEVHSDPGRGSTFQLKLPLTLAIIDGLVVGVGEERYIVPIFAVKEIVNVTPEILATVENRHEMAIVRGELLPVVRMRERFELRSSSERDRASGLLIVTNSSVRRFCLLVDQLIGKQEVVIKGLGETFKHVIGLAGAAILGDGRVGLILDPEALFTGGGRANGH